MENEVDIGATV